MDLLLELTRRYSEPQRRYHDLSHLASIFGLARDLGLELSDVQTWALWFHDAIYDPRAPDNEEQSAQLARERLEGVLGVEELEAVVTIILDTKQHEPSLEASKLVLDLDLSVLGTDRVTYERYARGIRFEYQHVSEEDFVVGRLRYVRAFRERALNHELFFELGEHLHQRAVANLEWELGRLEAALGQAQPSG